MPKVLNTKKKLVKIMTNGPIVELGNILGPVNSPVKIEINKIINMVQHGKKIIEINPRNQNETVLLTLANVTKNNFPTEQKVIMPTIKEEVKPVVHTAEAATQTNIGPLGSSENASKDMDPVDDVIASFTEVKTEPDKVRDDTNPAVVADFQKGNKNDSRSDFKKNHK
jgi:hypothetical protein